MEKIKWNVEYIRVSSEDQDERATYETQAYFNRKIAKERNVIIDKTYYDNMSGLVRNRPQLLKMLRDLQKIEKIYIYDQSRLTRSTEDLAYLIRVIQDANIELIGTSSPIKIGTLEEKMGTKMMGVWYEYEALKTGQRVRDTYESKKAEARKKGIKLVWGRPILITDKQFDDLVIERKIVNKTELAKMLGKKGVSPGTLYNYMKNRFGKALSRKEMILYGTE